jgi:NADPH2:quinone reductase
VQLGETVGIVRGDTGVDTWGTLAEKTVVDSSHLVPVPQGWSLQEVAGAPLVFLTAWQALTQWSDPAAPPAPGSVLLVTGASGGVGSASVLLAKSMGLTVVGLSRSTRKGEQLKVLGADFVADPADKSLRKLVLAAIAPKRLGNAGRVSVVGRSGGTVPEFNTATLFFRRNRIGGVTVADYSAQEAKAAWNEIVKRLDALGKRPVVDGVFPFADVKAAFARLSQGPMGKVLVKIAD